MINQRWQGILRPTLYFSSRMAFFLLLAVPSAFSQQQKAPVGPPPAPKATSPVLAQTNDRIAQLAAASDVKQGDYLIGSGDLLGIEVFDVPELSRDVRVNETGYISLPLMPTRSVPRDLRLFNCRISWPNYCKPTDWFRRRRLA